MLFFPKSSLDTTRNERERKAFVFPTPRLPFHVGFCALHQGTILLHSKYADTRQRTDERKVSTVHRRRQQRTDREIHMREQKKQNTKRIRRAPVSSFHVSTSLTTLVEGSAFGNSFPGLIAKEPTRRIQKREKRVSLSLEQARGGWSGMKSRLGWEQTPSSGHRQQASVITRAGRSFC